MKRIFLFILFTGFITATNTFAQTNKNKRELKIQILDKEKQTPLSFTSIVVLKNNNGTITNENGYFSLDISKLKSTDKIGFHYLGFKSKELTIKELQSTSVVHLTENIFNINNVFVFSEIPDAKSIVKMVLKNKDKNYISKNRKSTVFIRERNTTDIDILEVNLKKSSFENFDQEYFQSTKKNHQNHQVLFTDFYGNIYNSDNKKGQMLKVNSIKTVSLKEQKIGIDRTKNNLEKAFKETKEGEYWRIKSGVIGANINMGNEKKKKNGLISVNVIDTYDDNDNLITKAYNNKVKSFLDFSLMNKKEDWEFLYKTSRYNYTIIGGTSVNGEDVYIISFSSKKRGMYTGQMYVSMKTYALIRADYKYDIGKTGIDINVFGIGTTMYKFDASIYFENYNNNYVLKYSSRKTGTKMSIDRPFSIIKKKKRFLFNKKLKEVKFNIKTVQNLENLTEILVLDQNEITHQQFTNFKEKNTIKIIYVNKFDDKLWKAYNIIEPTKQMREYKKAE